MQKNRMKERRYFGICFCVFNDSSRYYYTARGTFYFIRRSGDQKEKKILFFVAVSFIILPYLPYESRAFLGYKITNECRIKKHLFQKKYYLADEKGKMLADGVFEWVITAEYIYGFDGYESEHAVGFIYDRKTKQGENFNHDEFISECKRLGLEYPSRFDNIYTLQNGLSRAYPPDGE